MDHSYPYIASLTREPFLFYEMRSTAKLMVEGNSNDAIVKECSKTDLSLCLDEAEPTGLGIYADSHW